MSDTKNKNAILKNTLFLYIRMFVVLFVSLFTVRIVLNALGVIDYGIYSAVGGIVTSLSFVSGVLSTASQRFFSFEIGKNNHKQLINIFSTMLFIFVSTAICLFLLLEVFGFWFLENKMVIPVERFSVAQTVFHLSLFTFLFSIVSTPFQALIISHEKMGIYAYISIFDTIVKLVISFSVKYSSSDKLVLYSSLLLVFGILSTFIYILYCRKNFPETCRLGKIEKNAFKSIFSFSSWTLFGSLSYMLNSQGVNIVLNIFFGPIVNAAYSVSNMVRTHVNQFSNNFFSAVRPQMVKAYATGDKLYLEQLYFFSSKIIFSLLFIIITPIFMEVETLLSLWIGDVKEYMPQFIRLMLVYGIILSMNDPITTIMEAMNKVKVYHLVVDGFTLLTLPTTYFMLLKGASPEYAFYISITFFVIAHFLRLVILKRYYGFSLLKYFQIIIFPIVLSVSITTAFVFAISDLCEEPIVILSLVKCLMGVMIAVFSTFFFILNKFERKKLLYVINSKLKILKI